MRLQAMVGVIQNKEQETQEHNQVEEVVVPDKEAWCSRNVCSQLCFAIWSTNPWKMKW
jgi:hypothetical protein